MIPDGCDDERLWEHAFQRRKDSVREWGREGGPGREATNSAGRCKCVGRLLSLVGSQRQEVPGEWRHARDTAIAETTGEALCEIPRCGLRASRW